MPKWCVHIQCLSYLYTCFFFQHLPDTNVVSSISSFFSGSIGDSDNALQVSTHWMSESGIIDLFVMAGPKPMDVFRQYAVITGQSRTAFNLKLFISIVI